MTDEEINEIWMSLVRAGDSSVMNFARAVEAAALERAALACYGIAEEARADDDGTPKTFPAYVATAAASGCADAIRALIPPTDAAPTREGA